MYPGGSLLYPGAPAGRDARTARRCRRGPCRAAARHSAPARARALVRAGRALGTATRAFRGAGGAHVVGLQPR
eukprot:scaffold37407_cov53-Phaeocystis_antarctica.AAC.2